MNDKEFWKNYFKNAPIREFMFKDQFHSDVPKYRYRAPLGSTFTNMTTDLFYDREYLSKLYDVFDIKRYMIAHVTTNAYFPFRSMFLGHVMMLQVPTRLPNGTEHFYIPMFELSEDYQLWCLFRSANETKFSQFSDSRKSTFRIFSLDKLKEL